MRLRAFISILALFPMALQAEIVLKDPVDDACITTMSPELRAFLEMPEDDRRVYFNDKEKRSALRKVRDAQPYAFRWVCTEGETGDFTVEVSEKPDFSEPSPALTVPALKKTLPAEAGAHEADLVNFLIGRKYYWKVIGKTADGREISSKTGEFLTDSYAPRLLDIPRVDNVRDLGGRKGLDGKMIRQGMIFRSTGLNSNSPDFNFDKTKWKKERIADFSIGATRLTPQSAAYLDKVLKIRTELDLRSPGEVASMQESPAGPGVKWVNHSSKSYGGIFGEKGDCAGSGPEMMAENFRLFCRKENYPIVFHCIAGADRTGALAYVLLGILGVDQNDLEKDWEITANDYFKFDKMFDNLGGGFDKFGAPTDPPCQKIEKYLKKIGITDEEIAQYRSIMLKN